MWQHLIGAGAVLRVLGHACRNNDLQLRGPALRQRPPVTLRNLQKLELMHHHHRDRA